MTRPRIIAVSNRVAMPTGSGKSAGGLAVGILSALEEAGGMWFGWSGKTLPPGEEPGEPRITERGPVTFATVDFAEADFDGYYNGFSNASLWPLFHYLLGYFSYQRHHFESYRRVNAYLARKLAPLLRDDDRIWIHDYHLIPLAAELRKLGVNQRIGFFLHVPFPDFDVLRVLPPYEEVLRSLCAYDVVGFQTARDLRSFQESLRQPEIGGVTDDEPFVEAFGRRFQADVFPIGIDVDRCETDAMSNLDAEPSQRLTADMVGRKLLLGVDRLDYSKGLERRFRAYEKVLELYPENRGKTVLLQIAPRTRAGVRAYDDIRHELEQAAGNINGRFAEIDWAPIRYINSGYDRPVLMSILRLARVGLVTPIRDGMNLVAKEFVAAQNPRDPGMLVLSRLAGAAKELDAAVLVNPYDREGVAEGIQQALTMPLEERVERHRSMIDVLRQNDIHAWRTRFLDALTRAER